MGADYIAGLLNVVVDVWTTCCCPGRAPAAKVMLFIKRLESDHDATPPPMRKAFTFAQGLAKLQVCGAFLHFLSQLQKLSPPAAFEEAEKSLRTQFMLGYMDPDLSHVLESQFPPGDVSSIAAFRLGCWVF